MANRNNLHSFDFTLAGKVGIEKALILKELSSILEYKENNEIDIEDGKSWVYYSSNALAKKFIYMKASSIRRWLVELEEEGYIESRYLSTNKRDRIKWYHVKSEEDCIAQNEQSPIDQNEQCNIYDTPHTKYTPHSKEINKESFDLFLEMVNMVTSKKYRGDTKSKRNFLARVKQGYKIEDMEKALKAAMQVKTHIETKFMYLTPEFITRPDKLETYLNAFKEEKQGMSNEAYREFVGLNN